jgi:SagB-type dehydrogenase family enzyme
LWDIPQKIGVKDLVRYPEWLYPSALMVFTGVWKRSSAKYGDLAYIHSLLEAGHMSENVLLVATVLGLETRPMAGFNDQLISELLDLKEENEQPVHSITLSKGSLQQHAPESVNEE